MKTSFYFVFWILIYPVLGLFHNSFIDANGFLIGLLAIWGISRLLIRLMPRILSYSAFLDNASVLEEVYTGDVPAFGKNLWKRTVVSMVTTVYFAVALGLILMHFAKGAVDDWVALVVFGIMTVLSVRQSYELNKGLSMMKQRPEPETCVDVAENIYHLNYSRYYEVHQGRSFSSMLSPVPHNFKAFQIFSMVVAVICTLLGLAFLAYSVIIYIGSPSYRALSFIVMCLLYGSLAVYFGLKDIISCRRGIKALKEVRKETE